MKHAPIPSDEIERLRVLESLGLVYSPAEERFDRITRLARRIFDVPTALVSLVAEDRQWFKSRSGIDVPETSREVSFCAHAILDDDTLIIGDARTHPAFADSELVKGPPYIRFYAGQPIKVLGKAIGTLCIIDHKPREFTYDDLETLRCLARMVETECQANSLSETQHALLAERREGDRKMLIDETTQCWNGEALHCMLQREIELSIRSDTDFSYLVLQLTPDPFRDDELTDEGARQILKETAQRLRRSLRAYDLVARIGPCKFAVFAPSCSAELCERLVDRIRASVIDVPFCTIDGRRTIEINIGIACAKPSRQISPQDIEKVAEMALEQATQSGRNYLRVLL